MNLQEIIQAKKISAYRLSQDSGIPYTTLTDILKGKTRLEKCSAETLYKLSNALQVSMEELIAPYVAKRCKFELFKSNVCHELKSKGDIAFIIGTLESDNIRLYYERKWYPESFYLLAMLDYMSRINGIPLCNEYDDLRQQSLPETLYPSSIIAEAVVTGDFSVKQKAREEAIPEFLQFNIVENEVRNVI